MGLTDWARLSPGLKNILQVFSPTQETTMSRLMVAVFPFTVNGTITLRSDSVRLALFTLSSKLNCSWSQCFNCTHQIHQDLPPAD